MQFLRFLILLMCECGVYIYVIFTHAMVLNRYDNTEHYNNILFNSILVKIKILNNTFKYYLSLIGLQFVCKINSLNKETWSNKDNTAFPESCLNANFGIKP